MKKASKQTYIYEKILAELESGKYSDGGRMPTEAEYSERFKLSRQTVRGALGRLEAEGKILRVQGSGTYSNMNRRVVERTGTVAVICTYISEYIFPSILRSIESVTAEHGCQLLMNSSNNSVASEREILSRLIDHPVDGIIVEGTKTALPNPNVGFYRTISEMGIPLVFINGFYPDVTGDNVIHIVTDDYAGGYEATRRLIQEGHSNICGIFKSDDTQGLNRYKGYIDALVQHGANVKDSNVIWFSTETKAMLLKNFASFMEETDSTCTGLVCYNDQIAEIALRYLEEVHSSISSVASFDQCLPLSAKDVKFSSFPHPREELGRLAAEKLFNMIEGKRESSLTLAWK